MRTQKCDKKACHLIRLAVKNCQIELAKPLRVAEDVDLGNLPTLTGKIRGAEQVARGALTISRLGILRRNGLAAHSSLEIDDLQLALRPVIALTIPRSPRRQCKLNAFPAALKKMSSSVCSKARRAASVSLMGWASVCADRASS